ncbi:MAG TPA: hypothetical protein PK760_16400, partial [Flavobacteriales bacterium]|nr:hypothetical protein [Flavobacteriales bacterium]
RDTLLQLGAMRQHHFMLAACCLFPLSAISQETIDLHAAVKQGNVEVVGRQLTLVEEPDYPGIQLSTDYGEGLAWLKGVDFSDGVIEFDVRGVNVEGHSFVGIAFHAANDSTFDAIYLRPFQFKKTDATAHSHSIQYISLPKHTWRMLRAASPGVYEQAIDPPPDPNGWVHMRVEVTGESISCFINFAKEPSLVVKKVTNLHTGRVGFYVADTSGGEFANITVAHVK